MAQDDLIILEDAPVGGQDFDNDLQIVPDFSKAYRDRRPKPSTTSYTEPDLAPDLELVPIPGAERSESDDELFRRIEDPIYKPTDDELDKFLDYKAKKPQYALDLIKGVWNSGKAVVGD